MDKARKKNIKRAISLVCMVAVVALLAAMPLIARQDPESDGPQASILSQTAQMGSIDRTLVGGGTLLEEDAVSVSLPSTVKLTEFLVQNGDSVQQGDPIAAVDRVTVMTAIAEVQEALEYLSEQMEEAREEDTDGQVEALVGGTVKILYAQEGERVQDVMLEHGALAVLSLDGKMAVCLNVSTDLEAGQTVTATVSDNSEVTGRVESNLSGQLIVTVADDGYAPGETVQVSTEAGPVGTGSLYIFSPWNATAYEGTVSSVKVREGSSVDPGDTLLELTGVSQTAAYRQLVAQRQEYEDWILELFEMYQTQQMTAPCDGIVSGVDKNSIQLLAAGEESYGIHFLANAPNGDDETQYINFVGQLSTTTEEGLVLRLNPDPVSVTDYKDLSAIPTDTAAMTETVGYNAQAPVYALSGGQWIQIDIASLNPGDILLFACDENGSTVWVVRLIAAAPSQPEEPTVPSSPSDPSISTDPTVPSDPTAPAEPGTPSDPTVPTEPGAPSDPTVPTEPGTPTDPTVPSDPGTPSIPSTPSITVPSGIWDGGTMPEQEPEYEFPSMETVDIALVTPQNTMTVEITVDELDVSGLRTGMDAQVRIEALGGEKFTARITDIGNTGQNNGGNSKFTVELTMERSADMLAGMNATASVVLDTVQDAVTVPAEALVEQGTKTLIYTGYDEENDVLTDPVEVTVGMSDGQSAQILSGLSAGTTCYYAYYDTLQISFTPDFGGGSLFSIG